MRDMSRRACLLLAALLLVASRPAPARADETLGTLIRWYLEDTSANRREDFLVQIEKLTNADRDPTGAAKKVIAAIRRGDHFRHPGKPALRDDEELPAPRFREDRPRLASLDGIAGRYAALQVPDDYDPKQRYGLVVDLGPFALDPPDDAVRLSVRLQAHEQAREYAWAAEGLVMSLIAHAFSRVSLDPDRVVLRADGGWASLGWYVVLHNPDRFAGYVLARAVWRRGLPLARNAHLHQALMIVPRKPNPFAEPFYRALRAEGLGHMIVSAPRTSRLDATLLPHIAQWRRRAVRPTHADRIRLSTTRRERIRNRWVSMAPRSRSRRTGRLQATWKYHASKNPATLTARIAKKNLVEVEHDGIAGFHLYLSPEVFDFDEPLRLRVNGQRVPTSRYVHCDLQDLLEDYRARRDPGLLYARRLDFKAR